MNAGTRGCEAGFDRREKTIARHRVCGVDRYGLIRAPWLPMDAHDWRRPALKGAASIVPVSRAARSPGSARTPAFPPGHGNWLLVLLRLPRARGLEQMK